MVTFHGRLREQVQLAGAFERAAAGRPQLVVLYGRRRVGKTFLLRHVLSGLQRPTRTFYWAATQDSAKQQLSELAAELAAFQGGEPPATTWSMLFDQLVDAAKSEPLIVALDEVPYLSKGRAAWASELQRAWDRARHSGHPCHLTLILTGSALATITSLVSSGGPLYGRPDELMRLDPFDLPTSASFLAPEAPAKAVFEAFAACGGYPLLLERWDTTAEAITNLTNLAGDPLGPLAATATVQLLDLPQAAGYRRLLSTVGRGVSKYSELGARADQRIERPLAHLLASGLVQHRQPLGEPNSRRGLYVIGDVHLAFWFAVVEREMQLIEGGQGPSVIRRREPEWRKHLGAVFEQEAREHAARLAALGTWGDNPVLVGEWWSDTPQAQFDVVGASGKKWAFVGEAKLGRFGSGDLHRWNSAIDSVRRTSDQAAKVVWCGADPNPEIVALGVRHFTLADMTGKYE
jgi:uncharacterized protein